MKRLFLFMCLLGLTFGLMSCKTEDGGKGNSGEGNVSASAGYLYTPGSDLWILYPENIDSDVLYELVLPIENARGKLSKLAPSSVEKHPNEIIIGKSDREVSKMAYMHLNRQDKENTDMAGYVIYSDGSSIALAYDEDIFETGIALSSVIEHFVENFVSGTSLELNAGVIANETFDLIEHQRAKDEEKRESEWNGLRTELISNSSVSAEKADKIIAALKDYYSVYDSNVLMWLADLYDRDTGGFYYSNSGRNTIGYGPDIESTRQALTILENSGILGGRTLDDALPDWMGDQIGRWVKGLQNENGFFYHPQWAFEEHTSSRLSRDLPQALELLSYFGYKPTYDAIGGTKGDGLLADGTPVGAKATGALRSNTAGRVSIIVPANASQYPAHLQTTDAFRKYLEEEIPINEEPYRMGNQLATQAPVIIARGKEYRDILIDFLDSKQNPRTGFWTLDGIKYADGDWEGINGFLKISAVYNLCGAPIRNAMNVAESCFDVLMTADFHTFGSVCYVYNPWYSIENVRDNIVNYSGGDLTEYNALRQKILERAPEAIARTRECIQLFMKDDGSASFGQTSTAATSVGMRVAVNGTNEGDVNATLINLFGSLNHLMGVLGYDWIKPFGTAEYMMFVKRVEGLGTIIKDQVTDVEPIDFEDADQGVQYGDFAYSWNSTGQTYVAERPDGKGNALLIDSHNNGNDNVMFPSATPSLISNKFYFEADMCVTQAGGTFAQITFYPYVYMLSLHLGDYDGDGENDDIRLTEDSTTSWSTSISNTIGTVAELGEWFNLKMEYYVGAHDEVRCLVYVNGELVLISNNYYARSLIMEGTPGTYCESARISILSDKSVKMYVDNVVMNKTSDSYIKPKKFPENMIVNVDAPEREEQLYDFEEGMHEDINVSGGSDTLKVTEGIDKALNIVGTGGSSLIFPVNIRKPLSNCSIFEADFTVDKSTAAGATYAIVYRGRNINLEEMVRLHLVTVGTGDTGYTTVAMAHTGVTGKLIDDIKIPHGETFTLRVEYYQREKTVLIYINGELIATSDLLCARANVNEFGSLVFKNVSPSGVSANITVDDIIVERNVVSFATATRPTVDEKLYDFEDAQIPSDIIVNGATLEDGKLNFTSSTGGFVKIPVNKRSVIRTAVNFKTLLDTSDMPDGSVFRIQMTDANGSTVLSYKFVVQGTKINIYEETANKSYNTPIGSFSKKTAILSMNYHFAKEIISFKIGDEAVAISSVLYSENAAALSCDYVVISTSDNATMSIDNAVAESYNMLYQAVSVSYPNSETGAGIYTFDTSSTGSVPGSITRRLISANAATKIKEMFVDGIYTKVLAFQTSPGANDSITIPITKNNSNKNGVALELYIKSNIAFDVFFKGGDTTFTGFYIAGEICDYKNSKYTFSIKSVNTAEWHKYRFEYTLTEYDYDGDGKNDIAMKVYVDGVLMATGHHTWAPSTAPAEYIDSVMLYTHSASEGEVCLDNIVFERCDVTVEPPAVRPPDLSDQPITSEDTVPGSYYDKIALTGKEVGLDYTGNTFYSLRVSNSAAVLKVLDKSSQMNDYKSNTYTSVTTLEGDSVLMIAKEGSNHSIPEIAFYNINRTDESCVVFESKVMFSAANSDQITLDSIYFSRFGFTSTYDNNGNYAAGYFNDDSYLTVNKMLHVAEVVGSFNPDADEWVELKYNTQTIEPDKWYVITMEYYREVGVICYYVDGVLINTVGVGANLDCNNVVFQLQGQAYGSEIYFDNTYFSSVDKEFVGELPEIPHVHEYSDEWSYDEDNHWRASTCTDNESCAEVTKDFGAHSYDAEGICVCGYENPDKDNVPVITEDSYYYKNVVNGTDIGVDYTGLTFDKLCVRSSNPTYAFLDKSGQCNAWESNTFVASATVNNESVFTIGKNGGNHLVPELAFYNINSTDKNCVVFESDVMFSAANTDQITGSSEYFSRFGFASTYDKDGNYAAGYYKDDSYLTTNKMLHVAEVVGSFDPDTDKWGELKYGGQTFENGKWHKIAMEYYKAEGIIKYYVNGNLINTVTVDANLECTNVVFQLQGMAYGSRIYFDNTYFATVDQNCTVE